jgi:hypothetical protein
MLPPTSPFRDVRDIVFPISKPRMCKRASDDPEKENITILDLRRLLARKMDLQSLDKKYYVKDNIYLC